MKKKNLLNIFMVLIILLIGFSGVMIVKNIKGTEKSASDEIINTSSENIQKEEIETKEMVKIVPLTVSEKIGIVTVERKGIAYEVDNNTEIQTDDIFRTKPASEIAFVENGKSVVLLSADTEIKVIDAETLTLQLVEGEIFVDRRNTEKDTTIVTEGAIFTPKGTTFSVTSYKSSYTAFVYSGKVTASGDKISENVTADAGNIITAVADVNGDITAKYEPFSVNSLSGWQISKLQDCGVDDSFSFTTDDMNKVVASREAEKAEAQQAILAAQQQAIAKLEAQQKEYDENYEKYLDALEKGTDVTTDAEGNIVFSTSANSCTIEIRCDTILDNMGNLSAGKEGYVPSNGKILSTVQVSFEKGETVFDVLKRVCSMSGIQLEYSWTPMYNSYYIEGINNLYEFDCGSESGWMYKVNGWFPNYGCSSYTLKDGDVIVWCYTCNGLGADVGGSVYG